MSVRIALALSSVSAMLVALGLAYFDGTLFPRQMMEKYHGYSFSLSVNGSVWANLVLMSLTLYFIGAYWEQWKGRDVLLALILGMLVSYALFHFVYLQGRFPDALAGGGRPISPAGWVFVFYSGVVVAIIGLFYFCSKPTDEDVVLIMILLALYIPVANHAVLGWLNSLYYFAWCPDIFTAEASPLQFIIWGEVAVVVATVLKLM